MASSTTSLKRNDVFTRNGYDGSYAVVIEEHQSNGEVRWAKHPVPFGTTAGGASPRSFFLMDYTPVDKDTDQAKSAVKGASALVKKLPRPARWGRAD